MDKDLAVMSVVIVCMVAGLTLAGHEIFSDPQGHYAQKRAIQTYGVLEESLPSHYFIKYYHRHRAQAQNLLPQNESRKSRYYPPLGTKIRM